MIALDDFHTLKRRVEALRRKQAEADGARAEVMRQLQDRFGVSKLRKAEALLVTLTAEEAEASRVYTDAYDRFVEAFGDRIPPDPSPED